MAITYEQALKCREFHKNGCKRTIGPKGGKKEYSVVYRRNGNTQTWKTRPNEFSVPVKYGVYCYDQIHHYDAHYFHTPEDCPLNKEGEVK